MKKSTSSLLPLWAATLTALVGVVCEAAVSWSGTAAELRVAPRHADSESETAVRHSGPWPQFFISPLPGSDSSMAAGSLYEVDVTQRSEVAALSGTVELLPKINGPTRIASTRSAVE
jgi:hypothetical protein